MHQFGNVAAEQTMTSIFQRAQIYHQCTFFGKGQLLRHAVVKSNRYILKKTEENQILRLLSSSYAVIESECFCYLMFEGEMIVTFQKFFMP